MSLDGRVLFEQQKTEATGKTETVCSAVLTNYELPFLMCELT